MKVSELTGALLDYWVAKAEGLEIKLMQLPPDNNTYAVHYYTIITTRFFPLLPLGLRVARSSSGRKF